MPVIAVFNQKGGVGKTTTTLNVGAALAKRGREPLLIDLDPQASLTLALGLKNITPATSLYAFFNDAQPLGKLTLAARSGAHVVPASLDLSKIETLHGGDASISRRLKAGIEREFADGNKLILIDCCPTLGVLTLNALLAADRVLMPVSADFLSLESAAKLNAALAVADAAKRKEMMKDIEQILQDSGIIIQPYWRKLYSHSVKAVQNYKMHPTYERDYGKIWLDQA